MDLWWVRCGNCSCFASPVTYTFICLTSCGHFVCNRCLQKSPLEKPTTSGYCYDCKKACSVVNLSADRLSPDIAFYFKDPVSLFQKFIEIENFQKLHRNRRVESMVRKRYMDDIVRVRLFKQRVEKYLPYLMEIYRTLCSKYGSRPTSQACYSEGEIRAFVDQLVAIQKQRQQFQRTPTAMETDAGSSSSNFTPMVQGSPTWSLRSGVGGAGTRGTPGSLFRAHVQSEMRGDAAGRRATPIGGPGTVTGTGVPHLSARPTPVGVQYKPTPTSGGVGGRERATPPTRSQSTSMAYRRITPMGSQCSSGGTWTTPTGSQYSGRITPGSGHRSNKPSPLLTSSRAIASSQARSPLAGAPLPPDPTLSRQPLHVQPPPGAWLLQSAGGLSSSATPTHSQIRHVMLSSGSGSQLQTKQVPQVQGNPLAYPTSSNSSAILANRPAVIMSRLGVGPQPLLLPLGSSRSLTTPTAAALKSMETPISVRRGVMLSSINKPAHS